LRLRSSAFAFAILLYMFVLPASAQQIDVSSINVAQTPVPGSGHDYIKMLQETVNPANGSVSLRIEAPVPKQRGDVNYPYYIFGYDSSNVSLPGGSLFYAQAPAGVYTPSFAFSWTDSSATLGAAGPGLIPGGFVADATVGQVFYQDVNYSMQIGDPPFTRNCGYYTGYVSVDPQGTRHSLNMEWVYNNNSTGQGGAGPCTDNTKQTGGDWQYQAALVGTLNTPSVTFYAADAHGRSYRLEDTNGNCCGAVGQTTVVNNQLTAVAIPGLTNPYSITYGTQSRSYLPGSTPLSINGVPACGAMPKETSTKAIIESITLPNSTTSDPQMYQFQYDPTYALMNKITYPSKATVTYTWGINADSESLGVGPGNAHCYYQHDWPYIQTRIVSFDGSTNALEQDFAYTTLWGTGNSADQWTTKTTTVTTKDLKRPGSPSFQTIYTYLPMSQLDIFSSTYLGQVAFENQIVYKDWNGAILKTVTKNWNIAGLNTPILLSQCVTLPNGQTAGTFYSYGALGVITDTKEYDYGTLSSTACAQGTAAPAATATRETKLTPQTFGVTPLYPTASMFDRPASVQVFDNGTLAAETDYVYDNYGTTGIVPVTAYGHDDAQFPVTYSNRGNATTITHLCLQGCSPAVATYGFDQTGQMLSVTDGCGNGACSDMAGSSHTTTYSYADHYSVGTPPGDTNTFITKITRPTTTNGVNHISNYTYSYPGGQLTSAEDENSQTTSYTYADPFARLTLTTYPVGGGQTSYTYNDAGPTPSVTTVKETSSSGAITTENIMDGMGHVTNSTLTYGSGSTANTLSTYDGLGNKYTVTNPYFSSSDPTYGVTTYTYDALRRVTQVKNPDNSLVTSTYAGRATQVNDAGNGTKPVQRISQTDYLGRLRSICEVSSTTLPNGTSATPSACGQDIGANGFLTSYGYDALGNLLSVSQGSLAQRLFTYNSLSQLVNSQNAESNTAPTGGTAVATTYSYDLNGNVWKKTEPAPNQTGTTTATLTYCYDSLNRMTAKGYTLQTCSNTGLLPSPAATYVFDTCPTSGCPTGYPGTPNSVGRVVESYTSTTGSIARTFSSYDAMGRVENQWQCTPENCSSGYYALPYTYDLLGDMLTSSNGQGVTFTYSYPSGQLSELTSSLSDANHPSTLLSGISYNAPGSVSSASLGNGMTETRGYSNRLRPESLTVAAASSVSTTSTGAAVVTGAEESYQVAATGSTGHVSLGGTCGSSCNNGVATVIVGTYHAVIHFSTGATFASIGSSMAGALSSSGLVQAYATDLGGSESISLNSVGTGSGTNYPLSCSITGGFFSFSCSGMSGGVSAGAVYDTGTTSLTVDGFVASTAYGSSSTPASLASALATQLNGSSSPVTAALSGNVITLTSKATGSAANYSLSVSTTSGDSGSFNPPSFLLSDSGPTLVGGAAGYDFALAYAPNGDVVAAHDSVNGN
jgi:hypothetical protein